MSVIISPISNADYRYNLKTQKNNSTNVLNKSRQINELTNYYYPAFKATPVSMEEIATSARKIFDIDIKQILTAEPLLRLQNAIENTIAQCNQILGKTNSISVVNTEALLKSRLSAVQGKLRMVRRGEVNNFLQQLSTGIENDTSFHKKDPSELKALIGKIDKLISYNTGNNDLSECKVLLEKIPTYLEMDFDSLYKIYNDFEFVELTLVTDYNKHIVVGNVLKDRFPSEFEHALDEQKKAVKKRQVLDVIDCLHLFH